MRLTIFGVHFITVNFLNIAVNNADIVLLNGASSRTVISLPRRVNILAVVQGPIPQSGDRLAKGFTHCGEFIFHFGRNCRVLSPVHKAIALQFLERQTEHALRDTEISFDFVKAHGSILRQGYNHKDAPAIADARENFIDAIAIGALCIVSLVQHSGSLFVTEGHPCALLQPLAVPFSYIVLIIYRNSSP